MSDIGECVIRALALCELKILAKSVVPYNAEAVEVYQKIGCYRCNTQELRESCVHYKIKEQ